jgi:hypothetical protein
MSFEEGRIKMGQQHFGMTNNSTVAEDLTSRSSSDSF